MILTGNIELLINPIATTSTRARLVKRLLSFVDFLQLKSVKSVSSELDITILALEGLMVRTEKLSAEDSEKMLESTSLAIKKFDLIAHEISSIDYFESNEIKDKIKYSQKCLYKLEAKLNRNVYKQKYIFSTPSEIKDGISKLNVIYSS
ncbi:hypothetical protein [Cellulophaga baltica]|uniref:hypothetical protein n=1 Tax=Cellulophaga baltica TaxID=76594 RepID=UPI000402F76B|nr:hypothetical protein [Cellulophaga baltica]AIY14644.1 hypothetical protein M667_16505 [Cellulophaga baltica NN016038]